MALMEVSFTGIDDSVDVEEFESFDNYRVIWGVLLSEERMGTSRYPSLETIKKFLSVQPLRLIDANIRWHVCGSLARKINNLEPLPFWFLELAKEVNNFQINLKEYNLSNIARFNNFIDNNEGGSVVLQWRQKHFALADPRFDWLFDRSEGKGILSDELPIFDNVHDDHFGWTSRGYAGGLTPENVATTVAKIQELNPDINFWIDMESGIRTEDDKFSFEKCRQVIEAAQL